MKKFLPYLLCMLALSSCAAMGEKYTYVPTPGTQPATIEFRDGINPRTVKTIWGDSVMHFTNSVSVYKIDGKYVRTDDRLPANDEPIVISNSVFLSPGAHTITFEYIGRAVGYVDAELDVKSGESYGLAVGADSVKINDSTGNVIKHYEVQYY